MGTCDRCDTHLTMIGTLQCCIDGVFKNILYPVLTTEQQKWDLVRDMFRESCLDNRTAMIQGFKKQNISSIKK